MAAAVAAVAAVAARRQWKHSRDGSKAAVAAAMVAARRRQEAWQLRGGSGRWVLLSAAQNKKIGDETSVIESRICRRTLTHGCNVKNLATETESHTTIKNGLFFVDLQTCRMLAERLAPQYGLCELSPKRQRDGDNSHSAPAYGGCRNAGRTLQRKRCRGVAERSSAAAERKTTIKKAALAEWYRPRINDTQKSACAKMQNAAVHWQNVVLLPQNETQQSNGKAALAEHCIVAA